MSLNINALWNLLNIPFSGYNTMYYYVKSACKVNRHSLRKCVPETVVRRGIYSGKLPVRTTKRRLGNTGGRNSISLHLLPKRACVSCRKPWRSENSQSQVKIEEGKVWSAAASLSTARESDCLYNHFSTSFRLLTISSTNFEAFEHFERFLCYQMFPCNF